MPTSVSGGPPIMGKKLVNFITCGCDGQKRKDRTTNNDLQSASDYSFDIFKPSQVIT
jgi:hypothetical protein